MKNADRIDAVKRLKISEKDLSPLVPYYEVCIHVALAGHLDTHVTTGGPGETKGGLRKIQELIILGEHPINIGLGAAGMPYALLTFPAEHRSRTEETCAHSPLAIECSFLNRRRGMRSWAAIVTLILLPPIGDGWFRIGYLHV